MGRTCAVLAAALLACLIWTGAASAQAPVASDFQKVTLDDNTQNPMQLDVAPDGRVFYIERDGRVQIWKPDSQQTVTAARAPADLEAGLVADRARRPGAGDAQPGERPPGHRAGAGLRVQQVGVSLLL